MFLGLGVESRGREREGQEGSATSQRAQLWLCCRQAARTSVLPQGHQATIAGDRRALPHNPDLPPPHRLFQVAAVLPFPWEASLLPTVPSRSSPCCEG